MQSPGGRPSGVRSPAAHDVDVFITQSLLLHQFIASLFGKGLKVTG